MIWFQKTVGIISLCWALLLTYMMFVNDLIYTNPYAPYIIILTIAILTFAGVIYLWESNDDSVDK